MLVEKVYNWPPMSSHMHIHSLTHTRSTNHNKNVVKSSRKIFLCEIFSINSTANSPLDGQCCWKQLHWSGNTNSLFAELSELRQELKMGNSLNRCIPSSTRTICQPITTSQPRTIRRPHSSPTDSLPADSLPTNSLLIDFIRACQWWCILVVWVELGYV